MKYNSRLVLLIFLFIIYVKTGDCPKDKILTRDDIGENDGWDCGTNPCIEGQMCKDGTCLQSCSKYDQAPKEGCYCGKDLNICNEGQICNVVECTYLSILKANSAFLVIGLLFGFALMYVLCFLFKIYNK